jgi:putative phosphoribosyl transferase
VDGLHGLWRDRAEAGRELAAAVRAQIGDAPNALVLGLPRGGVVVAAEVAAALGADLDVLVVRKVGVPWQPELALGAVTAHGDRIGNEYVISRVGLTETEIESAYQRAELEATRREEALREGRPPLVVGGRDVVVVDDGIATGATIRAAVMLLADADPAPNRVLIAIPVAPPDTVAALAEDVDAVVVLSQPRSFSAVGEWYERFDQVEDEEVRELLRT